MSARCEHDAGTSIIETRAFTGPVSARDENPVAHGNVCHTEQCGACGARRRVNANQGHYEYGTWGPSRAERIAAAAEAQERAVEAISRVPALVVEGVGISLDREGLIFAASGDEASICRTLAAQHGSWLASAQRARRLVIAAEEAAAEAQS